MQFFTPKFSFVVHKTFKQKLLARKEKRRFRGLNIYVPEFTGEGSIHPWLDAKRIKLLTKFYEDHRNKHRFTFKLSSDDKKKLNDVMQNYAEIHYLRMLQEKYWLDKHAEVMTIVQKEVNNLPYILKSELDRKLSEKEMEYYDRPQLDADSVYFEQRLRTLPDEEALNFELAQRLFRIAQDKLAQNE
ncbi:unnamed protein product [Paramecium octaurelia]|uniref:Uncharacterized protein n=1 Tax=Paramecium octaurelia TaxID=43137 RepID=A0A8S1YHI8_PAROT|nr:unnamed protein product [Paramecium octaurelia]